MGLSPRIETIEAGNLTNGIKGKTTGAAIPAGYVGENFTDSSSTFYTTSAANIISRTLQPGVWRIYASTTTNSGAGPTGLLISISTGSGAAAHVSSNQSYTPVANGLMFASTEVIANIGTATQYNLVGSSFGATVSNLQNSRMICVRIA